MKIGLNYIFFFIFIIALFVDGILSELVGLGCLLSIFILDKDKNKMIIGADLYCKSVVYILFYLILFSMHFAFCDYHNADLVKFYGYTKCICAPAIVLLVFPSLCKKDGLLKTFIAIMLFFNLLYGINGLLVGPDEVEYQLGSMNGCTSISVILFPVVVYRWTALNKRYTIERFLLLLYFATTFFVVYVSKSLTTMIILVMLLSFMFFLSKSIIPLFKRNAKRFCISIVLILLLLSFLISSNVIPLDPTDLRIRVAIWEKAYDAFISQDTINMMIGSFDCLVKLESKTLQAHNMFIDMLLIYGVLGVLFLVSSCIYFLNTLFLNAKGYKLYLLYVVCSYFLVCFLHPFYSGVFAFQIICVSSMLYLKINGIVNKYESERTCVY